MALAEVDSCRNMKLISLDAIDRFWRTPIESIFRLASTVMIGRCWRAGLNKPLESVRLQLKLVRIIPGLSD